VRAGVGAFGLALAAAVSGQTPEPRSEWLLGFGVGHTVPLVARAETSDPVLFLAPQWGWRLSSAVELVVEGHFAGYLGDPSSWFFGILPLGARFEFGKTGVRPYLALQAGFGWTDLDVIEIDRRFNYILSGGIGMRWPRWSHGDGILEVRILHYSNAGTVLPNLGLNSIVLVGGWRLR
jgi:hypothetical protein